MDQPVFLKCIKVALKHNLSQFKSKGGAPGALAKPNDVAMLCHIQNGNQNGIFYVKCIETLHSPLRKQWK